MSARPQLAILISGRGSNMLSIAQHCLEGTIAADVCIVLSDNPAAPGLERARSLGLATRVVPAREFADRAAFDQAIGDAIDACAPDIVALAGFMRILSSAVVERYDGRMLNIHPSLLPKYRGLSTHRRALEAGDREHGASVHFVIPELDAGPVVIQGKVAVEPGDNETTLSARVHAAEHIIYPRAVGWLAEGRLTYREDRAWFDGRPLDAPFVEDLRHALQS